MSDSLKMLSNKRLTYDIECYKNLLLVVVRDVDSGDVVYTLTMHEDSLLEGCPIELQDIMSRNLMISFNGIKYDLPILSALFQDPFISNQELKYLSDAIINDRLQPWQFERKFNVPIIPCNHVDLIEVAPGTASLKAYGARLGAKLLQELPIHHTSAIPPSKLTLMTNYCINDNVVTALLFEELEGAIDVRKEMSAEYGLDLRSKSDAQIGEMVIIREAERLTHRKIPKPKDFPRQYFYEKPDFVFFESPVLNAFLTEIMNTPIDLSHNDRLVLPKNIGRVFEYDGVRYQFGIGGLHSVDDHGSHYTDDTHDVYQIDVGSYYPNIILNGGFYPPQIGKEAFETVYRGLVNRRNNAKARVAEINTIMEGSTQCESMHALIAEKTELNTIIKMVKIVLNGAYGKLGSNYSKLFAPGMLANVTLTGQLTIIMLLEQLAKHNVQVLSVNTDGITVKVLRSNRPLVNTVVDWWCEVTGFTMDYDMFKSIHYRDVNNYFCEYANGDVKGIGVFAPSGIRIAPANSIIRDACFAFVKGENVEAVINECDDIHSFVTLKKATGGAAKDGVPIGATIRWYRSMTTGTAIHIIKSGNQVAGSAYGMPVMDYPVLIPPDLDREWYITKVYQTLACVGLLPDNGSVHYGRDYVNRYIASIHTTDTVTQVSRDQFFANVGVTKAMIKKYGIL